MDHTEFAQRRKKPEDELSEVERAAGIAPGAAEKAWGLAVTPYGIMGDEMKEFSVEFFQRPAGDPTSYSSRRPCQLG